MMETPAAPSARRRRVRYYADDRVTAMEMEPNHVMRPVRVRLTHSLVRSLDLHHDLEIYAPPRVDPNELLAAHAPQFVDFLRTAETVCAAPHLPKHVAAQYAFNAPCVGYLPASLATDDTPLFPGVWDLVSSYSAASLACARVLNRDGADVSINWAGGMHHAMPSHCSGFCHVNDIVLAIRELRKRFRRVLYVDLDAHHGDGVELAFRDDPTVMTVSIHQFGNGFFPGTGGLAEQGIGIGHGFSVNLPLNAGATDATYTTLFKTALRSVMHAFDPEACVLQCGADTIFGDPIGQLRISTYAFADCARYVLDAVAVPTVMLGGGGYNVTNTARTWAILTAVATGRYETLPLYVPQSDPYFFPHYCCADPVTAAEDPSCPVRLPLLHVVPPTAASASTVAAVTSLTPGSAPRRGKRATPKPATPVYDEAPIIRFVNASMKRVLLLRQGLFREPLSAGMVVARVPDDAVIEPSNTA
jgi:histone deacetylase 1/2